MTVMPEWVRDATAPGLAERRALLLPGHARQIDGLAAGLAPTDDEVARLLGDLMPEGDVARDHAPQTPARTLRNQHVRETRRGRRWAIGLAVAVVGLSVVGPLSRKSEALEPGQRTRLDLSTLHTTGAGIAVAGRGELTLEDREDGPVLVLHQGSIEVAALGDERVRLMVGPHVIEMAGGRLHMARVNGEVEITADEGVVRVFGPDGVEALAPGDPPWEAPPPEAVESCGGEIEPEDGPGVVARPDATPAHASTGPWHTGARLVGMSLRVGAPPAELGMGGRRTLASLEEARRSALAERSPGDGPTLDDLRPIIPMSGSPLPPMSPASGGGPLVAAGATTGASAAGAAPVGGLQVVGGSDGPTGAAMASAGAPGGMTPTHSVAHTVETGPNATPIHHDSTLGVCMMPAEPTPPELHLPVAPPTPSEAQPPTRSRRTPTSLALPAAGQPSPARTLPLPPGLPAPEAAGSPPSFSGDPAVQRALQQVMFGTGINVLECEP